MFLQVLLPDVFDVVSVDPRQGVLAAERGHSGLETGFERSLALFDIVLFGVLNLLFLSVQMLIPARIRSICKRKGKKEKKKETYIRR